MAYHFVSKMPIKRNYAPDMDARLLALDEAIQSTQGMISGMPNPGVHLVTFADSDATLGVAGDLWEMRIIKANANRYIWDPDNDYWRLLPGNRYPAVGDIPANVHPVDGDMALVGGEAVYYDGALWAPLQTPTSQALQASGYFRRPVFARYSPLDKFTMAGGGWLVDGKGWVYIATSLTYYPTGFTPGAWRYIYLNYDAITGPGPITTAQITDSDVAPAFDRARNGYFNGDDRCIFFLRGNTATSYVDFMCAGSVYQHLRLNILSGHTGATAEISLPVLRPFGEGGVKLTFHIYAPSGGYVRLRTSTADYHYMYLYAAASTETVFLDMVPQWNRTLIKNSNTAVSVTVGQCGVLLPDTI